MSTDEKREPEAGAAEEEEEEDGEWEEFDAPVPPDGGWGWVVMISCFLSNVIVDGVCYTYSVFFNELREHFEASRSKTALVGSLVPAFYLLVGPLVSAMVNKFGMREVTIVGSVMASAFFVISSFSTSINMMLVTYGIMGGSGFGLMYLPSIVMVGYYFDKYRAFATGVSVCGAGIGTFLFAPLGTFLVENYGWKGANIIIGGIILNGIVFGLTYRPLKPQRQKRLVVCTTGGGGNTKMTIMNKIAAEKRTRTYSVDDHTYAAENGHTDTQATAAAAGDSQVPEVVVTKADQPSQQHNKLLDGAGPRSRQSSVSMTASQRSIARRNAANPFARADILYTGSLTNTAEYRSCGDMKSYVSSVMNMAAEEDDDAAKRDKSFLSSVKRRLKHVMSGMFDFSLLKTVAFVPILAAGVLFFFGLYTPFVYVTRMAITELGVTKASASLILSVLGACSTVSRIVTGILADRPRIDAIILHNGAAIIAGVMTCFVSLLNSYALLMLYGAIFGTFTATFIALRSIVLVDILGIQKLTNAFGITVLFQGFAVLMGSPISGAILDATGSYVYPFLVSGSCLALAGIVCLPVRRIARWEQERAARQARSSAG